MVTGRERDGEREGVWSEGGRDGEMESEGDGEMCETDSDEVNNKEIKAMRDSREKPLSLPY